MEILQETSGASKTFLTHVFNSTEEGKGEVLNVAQYALLAIIPIIMLNKLIQRFVPEADPEKSSLELTAEIVFQVLVVFVGIILIHRIITYIPTYSGFKYDDLSLTNSILAFLLILLSIQTKLGIKVNILYDRVVELWNGPSAPAKKAAIRNRVRFSEGMSSHSESQADNMGSQLIQSDMFPPSPSVVSRSKDSYDGMMRPGAAAPSVADFGPVSANSILGGAFGSAW